MGAHPRVCACLRYCLSFSCYLCLLSFVSFTYFPSQMLHCCFLRPAAASDGFAFASFAPLKQLIWRLMMIILMWISAAFRASSAEMRQRCSVPVNVSHLWRLVAKFEGRKGSVKAKQKLKLTVN